MSQLSQDQAVSAVVDTVGLVRDRMDAGDRAYVVRLGARVTAFREAAGLSIERAAAAAGLTAAAMRGVEAGGRSLKIHRLRRLAAALDVDLGRLVTDPPCSSRRRVR